MSVSKSAFPSLRVESKDWSGLTTENHLGALFGEKPEQISKKMTLTMEPWEYVVLHHSENK